MSVESIIAGSQAYADRAITDGENFVTRLLAIMEEDEFIVSDLPTPEYQNRFGSTSTTIILPTRPTITISEPTAVAPVAPTIALSEISDGDVVVPDFDENPPPFDFPATPSADLPSVPSSPTVNEPDYPSSPAVVFPSAPTLYNPELPVPPVITIPEFSAEFPDDDLIAPTNSFDFAEVPYTSAMLDSATAKLLYDLENGGYGIDTADEQAIWERARAREQEASQATIDEIMNQAASRGFPLPPGDMLVSMDRARNELQKKLSALNSEITTKRADLYVENRKFTIDQVRQYETMTINYHNAVMERSLNVERARIEVAIAVYNSLVSRFTARLQGYQTAAQVFTQRVQAEVAKIEIYKAEIEGAKLQGDLQRLILDNYTAQLGAINSVVGIYRTQLEAAQTKANIERTRIDVFNAQIQAYSTQVQAKVAQFNMYTSQVNAERAKIDAYQSKVNAYTSRVQASQTKSAIALARLRTEVEQAQALVAVYRAKIDGYNSELQGQTATINARLGKYQTETQLYQADYAYLVEALKLNSQLAAIENSEHLKNAEIATANARYRLDSWVQTRQIKNQAAGTAGGYFSSRANAALAGINALVSQA